MNFPDILYIKNLTSIKNERGRLYFPDIILYIKILTYIKNEILLVETLESLLSKESSVLQTMMS